MTGEVFLVIRIIAAILLYGFLAAAVLTIWRDLRLQTRLTGLRLLPHLKLAWVVDEKEYTFEVTQDETTLGRDAQCACRIQEETVSSRHARLAFHHNQWWVEDLQSTNGTCLNDQPLTMPTVILNQDVIRCGAVLIKVTFQS